MTAHSSTLSCNYRLAVVFLVLMPLVLWIWSLVEQTDDKDAIKRILFGYWQTSSLLMFTVYLQIGAQPLSFATAAAVQVDLKWHCVFAYQPMSTKWLYVVLEVDKVDRVFQTDSLSLVTSFRSMIPCGGGRMAC